MTVQARSSVPNVKKCLWRSETGRVLIHAVGSCVFGEPIAQARIVSPLDGVEGGDDERRMDIFTVHEVADQRLVVGWSSDVTMDIADELRRRFAEYDEVPASVQEFLESAIRAH